MESEHKNAQPKMSLELEQKEPPEKKNLWQKIKGFISNVVERRTSEEWRRKDLDDW